MSADKIDNFREIIDDVLRSHGLHVIDIVSCDGATDVYVDHPLVSTLSISGAEVEAMQTWEAVDAFVRARLAHVLKVTP
jgi:hypothetical protein